MVKLHLAVLLRTLGNHEQAVTARLQPDGAGIHVGGGVRHVVFPVPEEIQRHTAGLDAFRIHLGLPKHLHHHFHRVLFHHVQRPTLTGKQRGDKQEYEGTLSHFFFSCRFFVEMAYWKLTPTLVGPTQLKRPLYLYIRRVSVPLPS